MMNRDLDMEQKVRERIGLLHKVVPGTIGDLMEFQLMECDPVLGTYKLRCVTGEWMRNVAGTLHGGMCATILDQAMGFISFCAKPGEGTAPTVQLQVNYHRPLIPGEAVLVNVRVVSITKKLMHLTAEAALESAPERICLTGTGLYFFKEADSSKK